LGGGPVYIGPARLLIFKALPLPGVGRMGKRRPCQRKRQGLHGLCGAPHGPTLASAKKSQTAGDPSKPWGWLWAQKGTRGRKPGDDKPGGGPGQGGRCVTERGGNGNKKGDAGGAPPRGTRGGAPGG